MTVFLVSGCAYKQETGMEISKDKKVKVTATMLMDDETIDTMLSFGSSDDDNDDDKEVTDKERWAYIEDMMEDSKESGVKVEKYEEKGYKGFKVVKEVGNIDDITKESAKNKTNLNDEDFLDSVLFVKDGSTYKSNMTYSGGGSSDMGQYKDSFKEYVVTFKVTLPEKATSNNATEVSKDGKTLTWDLTKGDTDIDFSFKFGSNLLYIILGVVALAVVVVILVVVLTKKNKGNNNGEIQNS